MDAVGDFRSERKSPAVLKHKFAFFLCATFGRSSGFPLALFFAGTMLSWEESWALTKSTQVPISRRRTLLCFSSAAAEPLSFQARNGWGDHSLGARKQSGAFYALSGIAHFARKVSTHLRILFVYLVLHTSLPNAFAGCPLK